VILNRLEKSRFTAGKRAASIVASSKQYNQLYLNRIKKNKKIEQTELNQRMLNRTIDVNARTKPQKDLGNVRYAASKKSSMMGGLITGFNYKPNSNNTTRASSTL